jgi:hypothetical protein
MPRSLGWRQEPLWAFLMILVDVAIIYQLTARWDN